MIDNSNSALGMLPEPRIPMRPKWPTADAVAALAGEELAAPIRVADAAQRAAEAAVDDLERHRPGPMGTKWREALEADAAAHAAGEAPSKWAAAALLEADPQRWATARVLAGAVAGAWRDAGKALDRASIRAAAAPVADELSSRFEAVARHAWQVREDPHRAWPLRGEGEAIIAKFRRVQDVVYWCDGALYDPKNVGYVPGGPEARGHWICLELVLRPNKKMLGIPRDVVWPEGAERLLGQAIPAGRGFAELRRDGFYEIAGAD